MSAQGDPGALSGGAGAGVGDHGGRGGLRLGRLSMGRPSAAALSILVGVALFAIQDALMKLLIENASLWQLQVLRAALIALILAAPAALFGQWAWVQLRTARWPAIRAALLCISYILFYAGLPFLSVSEAAAALYTTPLFVTVFAAIFLGERIGPRRVVAVILGFVGVAIILRPDGAAFELAMLFPLGAAAFYALAIVVTRARCVDEPAGGLALAQAAFFGLFAGVALTALAFLGPALDPSGEVETLGGWAPLVRQWAPMDLALFAAVAAVAVVGVLGMIATTQAYQWVDASRIAPLEYAYLIFAILLDLAVWGVAPTPTTALGMAIIAAAGGFVAWREGRPPRPSVQTHGEEPWSPDPAADLAREPGGKSGAAIPTEPTLRD